jgi:hypothetical protein
MFHSSASFPVTLLTITVRISALQEKPCAPPFQEVNPLVTASQYSTLRIAAHGLPASTICRSLETANVKT